MDPPSYPSLPFVVELAASQLDRQLVRLDALDAKLATLLGLGGVVLALLFGTELLAETWDPLASLGTALLVGGLFVLLLALRARVFRLDPNVRSLREENLHLPLQRTQLDALDSVLAALEHNHGTLVWKARLLDAGTAISFTALVLFMVRAVYLLEG